MYRARLDKPLVLVLPLDAGEQMEYFVSQAGPTLAVAGQKLLPPHHHHHLVDTKFQPTKPRVLIWPKEVYEGRIY
jgi:hypothetical protein